MKSRSESSLPVVRCGLVALLDHVLLTSFTLLSFGLGIGFMKHTDPVAVSGLAALVDFHHDFLTQGLWIVAGELQSLQDDLAWLVELGLVSPI